jgi:hypothetical protein
MNEKAVNEAGGDIKSKPSEPDPTRFPYGMRGPRSSWKGPSTVTTEDRVKTAIYTSSAILSSRQMAHETKEVDLTYSVPIHGGQGTFENPP